MSLFNNIEVDPKMIPFVNRKEGVGIVKVDGYGKASARMESYKLILDSYDDKHPIIESISSINYLSYDKGNFFKEPKLEIGIAHKKYILAGVDNNDDELKAFYETLLNTKNLEKQQRMSSRTNMSRTEQVSEDIEKEPLKENVEEQNDDSSGVNVDLDKEAISDNTLEESADEIIDDKSDDEPKSENIKEFMDALEENAAADEEFNVLEEAAVEEDIVESEEKDNDSLAKPEEKEAEKNDEEQPQKEAEINEDLDEVEDIVDEDIDLDRIINDDESEEVEDSQEKTTESETEESSEDTDISDELDESDDFEEIDISDDFNSEKSNQPEVIDEVEVLDEPEILDDLDEPEVLDQLDEVAESENEEVEVQQDLEDEDENESEEVEEDVETDEQDVVEKSDDELEVKEAEQEEIVVQNGTDDKITEENVASEINQMKQNLFQDINSIQNEISAGNQNFAQYMPTIRQVDPVDQIRRYYELKEDGIITEEEFELKKKQLLDI